MLKFFKGKNEGRENGLLVQCHLVLCLLVNFSLIRPNCGIQLQWCGQQEGFSDETVLNGNWTVSAPISAELTEFSISLVTGSIKCHTSQVVEIKLNESVEGRGKLFSNGYLQPNKSELEYFHPQEYCIYEITEDHMNVRYCVPPVDVTYIPKCCPMSELFTSSKTKGSACRRIKDGSSQFYPTLYKNFDTKSKNQPFIHYKQKKKKTFTCPPEYPVMMTPHANAKSDVKEIHGLGLCFQIREDGTLLYLDSRYNWNEMSRYNYCIEGVHVEESGTPFRAQEEDFIVVSCAIPQKASHFRSVMYGCALIASSVFLLITFIVYALWNQKNMHGWTTMSYTSSMFFMYLFLGTAFLLVYTRGHQVTKTLGCKTIAILAHFFILSTFCWLTVRSFDLYWTFRGMRTRNQRSKGLKRFIVYAGFGWGLPIVFVTISAIIDSVYSLRPCNTVIVPFYGFFNCYLKEEAHGVYVYYPIGILLSLNLLFVTLTIHRLYMYKKETKLATQNMNQERQQMFKLFIKLFFVMGVTWIFEIVSWMHSGIELKWYWAILDLINLLQAAAICIIFVCKEDVMRSLKTQYPSLEPILNPLGQCLQCQTAEMDTSATMMTSIHSLHVRIN